MKKLNLEQHQMLEDLTGLQHTIFGTVRKHQNRSDRETRRLGLKTRLDRMSPESFSKLERMLAALKTAQNIP